MGVLTRSMSATLERAGLGDPPSWLREALGAVSQSASGVSVTPKSAMTFASVFGAVNIIATDIAKLPIEMYKHLVPIGKTRAFEHPLDPVLHDVAYEDDTTGTVISAFHAKQYLQASALLWGNGYAQILANGQGEVTGLFPLPPRMVTPYRELGTNILKYRVTTTAGTAMAKAEDIFHLKSVVGSDTLDLGIGPITYQRESIGLGIAQQEYLARFYGNDSSPGGILTHPGRLRPAAKKALKKGWEEAHAPLSKKHRVALLEEGVTWTSIGMPLQDAQFLENRKFQIEEVCRMFRLPPHKLFHMDRGDKSTIEQNNIEYVNDCLGGWMENWRSQVTTDLLLPKERRVFFCVFNAQPLLRGDFATRMNGYAVMLDRGVYSPDDVRDREDDNPIADGKGKGYYHALNMVDVTKPPPPPPAPGAAVPKGPGDQPENPDAQKPAGPAGKNAGARMPGATRSLVARQRYAAAHVPLFEVAAGKLIDQQLDGLDGLLATLTEWKDLETFDASAAEFFEYLEPQAYQALLPLMANLAESVRAEAAEEIGMDGKMTDGAQAFVRDVAQLFAQRHTAASLFQLRQTVQDSRALGLAGVQEALRALGEGWRATLPAVIAAHEAYRTTNAVAVSTYRDGGVPQKQWLRSRSCGWCDQLEGRITGIEDPFLVAGDALEAQGLGTLRLDVKIGHGPAHQGCTCGVGAVIEAKRADPLAAAVDAMASAVRSLQRPRSIRREVDFKREGNAIVGKTEVEHVIDAD